MQNGVSDTSEELVTLPQSALRRLARLLARAEGAAMVAQVAQSAADQAKETLRAALTEACEDEGAVVPQDANAPVDINWKTGVVTLKHPEPMTPTLVPPAESQATL